ncbi:Calreticulin [Strongyloides ratti]|uniref:Calreticulin n=1 Tax=Strongyloides ratti TaxID=34506 RepID=A0A090LG12_STRRB|nr:Calreticulin [Strongyloides ratti]CEF67088.1 Calreticulin [Strongyloides ratti]
MTLYLPILYFIFIFGLQINCNEESSASFEAGQFSKPSIPENVYMFEYFTGKDQLKKTWVVSKAKKEGVDEDISKFDGLWDISEPSNVLIQNDMKLVVKSKAKHHAISSKLNKPFEFKEDSLVIQYEVLYEEGQECGGGYLKLLVKGSEKDLSLFNDKTPYSILFGPDKCGTTAKVHFIIRFENPINKTISEHSNGKPLNLKDPNALFDDKKSHLYTLVINKDNTYSILIDNVLQVSGDLLKDMVPPLTPPKEIHDPNDKKPSDWDDRETIFDETATKPDDWDENQPETIVDVNAVKPSDWLEDENELIPNPEAEKPKDWDDEMDGEWEAPLIKNPRCEGVSGCGKWTQPTIPNPAYKGKWKKPKIPNPNYKGVWSPKLIENPNYFLPKPFDEMLPFSAIGIELWTMSKQILFDNIIITNDLDVAKKFADETFALIKKKEEEFESINNPSVGLFKQLIDATEDKPYLWVVYALCVLLPLIFGGIYLFGRKTNTSPVSYDKERETVEEVEGEEEEDDNKDEEQLSGSSEEDDKIVTITKDDLEEELQGSENQDDDNISQKEESNTDLPKEDANTESPKEAVRQRKVRARRQD